MTTSSMQPFHLAFPVRDIHEARVFYGKLDLQEGRSAKTWVDFSLFGHQIVCHEVQGYSAASTANAGMRCSLGMHASVHLYPMGPTCPSACMALHIMHTAAVSSPCSVYAVDGDPVPVPHFGVALTVEQFHELAQNVETAGIPFILQPHLRFKGDRLLR